MKLYNIIVDGNIRRTYNVDYGQTLFVSTYTIPSDASDFVKIIVYAYVSGVGTQEMNKATVSVVSSDSGGDSGSSSGSGSNSVSQPTIGNFTVIPVDSNGNEVDYVIQGITKILCSVSGCVAGSGNIESYRFVSPSSYGNVYSTSSYANYTFNPNTFYHIVSITKIILRNSVHLFR